MEKTVKTTKNTNLRMAYSLQLPNILSVGICFKARTIAIPFRILSRYPLQYLLDAAAWIRFGTLIAFFKFRFPPGQSASLTNSDVKVSVHSATYSYV